MVDKQNITLLSYPRSGNTFTRYILEFLTGYSSLGYNNDLDKPLLNVNKECRIFKKHGHTLEEERYFNNLSRESKFILLLRHPYECYVRHNSIHLDTANFIKDFSKKDNLYIKNLIKFNLFMGEKKILFYEQLMTDHESYVQECSSFLNTDQSRVSEFLENYDFHKAQGIKKYTPKSRSLGSKDPIRFYRSGNFNFDNSEFLNFFDRKLADILEGKYVSQISNFYRGIN